MTKGKVYLNNAIIMGAFAPFSLFSFVEIITDVHEKCKSVHKFCLLGVCWQPLLEIDEGVISLWSLRSR